MIVQISFRTSQCAVPCLLVQDTNTSSRYSCLQAFSNCSKGKATISDLLSQSSTSLVTVFRLPCRLIWCSINVMRTYTPSPDVTMKVYQQITVSFMILYHMHVTLFCTVFVWSYAQFDTLSLLLVTCIIPFLHLWEMNRLDLSGEPAPQLQHTQFSSLKNQLL